MGRLVVFELGGGHGEGDALLAVGRAACGLRGASFSVALRDCDELSRQAVVAAVEVRSTPAEE